MKKRLQKIAHQLVELEKKAQNYESFNYEFAMTKLISNISLADLLEIDEYIQKEKLLTK